MLYEAERRMTHPRDLIREILLDVARVPDWNPALSGVDTDDRRAREGHRYPVRVRSIVPARLRYLEITPALVRYRLETLGNAEDGEWELSAAGEERTLVVHRMTHTGPVLRAMSRAFAPVAAWRLERLDAISAARSSPGRGR